MTTVTGPLRDPNQAPTIAAKNAETVELLRRDLIEAQKERIAELEVENVVLRAVVLKSIDLSAMVRKYKLSPDIDAPDDTTFARPWIPEAYFQFVMAVDELRENGYLPEEARP